MVLIKAIHGEDSEGISLLSKFLIVTAVFEVVVGFVVVVCVVCARVVFGAWAVVVVFG